MSPGMPPCQTLWRPRRRRSPRWLPKTWVWILHQGYRFQWWTRKVVVMLCFQVVDVSDPPVREAGTVQADVDELVKYSTSVFWFLIHAENLLMSRYQSWRRRAFPAARQNLTTTFGPSFILGQPWVIKIYFWQTFILKFLGQPPEFSCPSCLTLSIFNRIIPILSDTAHMGIL